MRRALWLLALALYFLALVSIPPLFAQTPTDYVARYYVAGASAPVQTESFNAGAITCNLAPSPPGTSTVNPTRLEWDDIAVAGRVCRRTSAGSGSLPSLPFGSYEATLTASNAGGTSAESNRAPFSRAAVAPGAPTAFRVVP